MGKYRKKPIVIEAIQWDGLNLAEIQEFAGDKAGLVNGKLHVHTVEGSLYAGLKDWIIKGVQGEFYPCKPDIFAATYEEVK